MFRKYLLGFVLLGLVAIAALLIYLKLHPKTLPANLVAGVGRIDGDLVNINAKYPGRIAKLLVEEGEPIKKGQIVATLVSKEIEAKKEAMAAQITAKEKLLAAQKVALQIERNSLPQNVKKALAAKEAKSAAKEALRQEVAALASLVAQDRKDLQRLRRLRAQNLVAARKVELARLKLQTDSAKLRAAQKKLAQLQAAIDAADATLDQAKSALQKIEALKLQIAALSQEIAALQAQKRSVEAMLQEMTIRSPLTGYVVDKVALSGEVVGAGMSILTAIDPKTLYLKIYVDTLQNGRIHLGDKAEIFLDAFPDDPIPAVVTRIAQKAEFTPKEVEVRSDRIQRVFAVHLRPLHPDTRLKLGLPAIGIISIDGKGLPKSLTELPVM